MPEPFQPSPSHDHRYRFHLCFLKAILISHVFQQAHPHGPSHHSHICCRHTLFIFNRHTSCFAALKQCLLDNGQQILVCYTHAPCYPWNKQLNCVCLHSGAGCCRQVGICRREVRGAAGRGAADNVPADGGRGTPSVWPAGLAHRPYMCRGCLRRWLRHHRGIRTQEEGVSNHGMLCLTYMFTVHAVFYSNQFFFFLIFSNGFLMSLSYVHVHSLLFQYIYSTKK